MAKPGPKPRNGIITPPWNNLEVTSTVHAHPGVYCLRHVRTGLCYITAVSNVFKALSHQSHLLRTGAAGNRRLQQLYAEDPRFEVDIKLNKDAHLPHMERQERVRIVAYHWKLLLGPKMCINKTGLDRVYRAQHPNPDAEVLPAYRGVVDRRLLDRQWFNPDPVAARQEQAQLETA